MRKLAIAIAASCICFGCSKPTEPAKSATQADLHPERLSALYTEGRSGQQLDMRKNGRALLSGSPSFWELHGDTISITKEDGSKHAFTVEGADIVDEHGARWVRSTPAH